MAQTGSLSDTQPSMPLIRVEASGTQAVIEGVIERVTFHNPENGYGVVKIIDTDGPRGKNSDAIAVIGLFPSPVPGESIRCTGTWVKHPEFGRQFKADRIESVRPATLAAIEKYLGSGLVKGIGPATAKKIVARFGDKTLDILDSEPARLHEIPGLGRVPLDRLTKVWEGQKAVQSLMLWLQGNGVTPSLAHKIHGQYGDQSEAIVKVNPYRIANELWGVGFRTADQLAQRIGMSTDAPQRLRAGLLYTLKSSMDSNGHCFMYEDALLALACEPSMLGADPDLVQAALEETRIKGEVIADTEGMAEGLGPDAPRNPRIYLPAVYQTECRLAARVKDLIRNRPVPIGDTALAKLLDGIENAKGLSEQQTAAVLRGLNASIVVITGGPGTGKTTTTNVLVRAYELQNRKVLLASPTGRAAKRASEVTGRPAKTIHRLLSWKPELRAFEHNRANPLQADVIIIDEASMLDLALADALFDAVPDGAQVVLVGDVDQLPSVGPGNILSDLIGTGLVPVARLTEVFRQAAESHIITSAHAINAGKAPRWAAPTSIKDGVDCVLLEVEDADDIPLKVAGIIAKSLPNLGWAAGDATVLVPMQRGTAGARNLNTVLQACVNPKEPGKGEIQRNGGTFRLGDRVMQRVNDYEKNVFNGDIGTIAAVSISDLALEVRYPDGLVHYNVADLDQLQLAYAMTTHKSQGSEFPVVVVVMHTQHYVMLQRNLLYTALTRAKKLAILVGSKRALDMAVKNHRTVPRCTWLSHRIRL